MGLYASGYGLGSCTGLGSSVNMIYICNCRSCYRRKTVKQEFNEDDYDFLSSFNGRYHMLGDGKDTEFITNTDVTTDTEQIPLSRILGDLNTKRDDPRQRDRLGLSMESKAPYKVQTQPKYTLRRRSST